MNKSGPTDVKKRFPEPLGGTHMGARSKVAANDFVATVQKFSRCIIIQA